MHPLTIILLSIGVMLFSFQACSTSPPPPMPLAFSSSFPGRSRSCPEEYRELRRRDSQWNNDDDDDDDDDDDSDENEENQWREAVCEQAMSYINRNRQRSEIDPKLMRTYCSHYDESYALARENSDGLCESKKQELMKKRQASLKKKKRFENSSSSSDSDEDEKRRALRRRELKKRLALRFIRKRSKF